MIFPSRVRRRMTASASGSCGTDLRERSCSVISGQLAVSLFSAARAGARPPAASRISTPQISPARLRTRGERSLMATPLTGLLSLSLSANGLSTSRRSGRVALLECDGGAVGLDDAVEHRPNIADLIEIPPA